jgi:hypothetical protein
MGKAGFIMVQPEPQGLNNADFTGLRAVHSLKE